MSVLLDPQRSASTRRNTRHLPYMFIVKVRTWNSFLLKIHEWLHWRGLEKLNKIKQVHFHRLAEFQTLHNSVYPCECRFDLLKVIMSAIHLWIWLDDCKRDDRISTMLEHFAQKIIYLESVFLSFFFFFSGECRVCVAWWSSNSLSIQDCPRATISSRSATEEGSQKETHAVTQCLPVPEQMV